jgi:hypothetical protein
VFEACEMVPWIKSCLGTFSSPSFHREFHM